MKDSRNTIRGNLRHQLVDMMFLAISAAVCGVTDWIDVEEFGKGQLSWLRKYFPFKNGIPSHDTLGRVFAQLDTEAVQSHLKYLGALTRSSLYLLQTKGCRCDR